MPAPVEDLAPGANVQSRPWHDVYDQWNQQPEVPGIFDLGHAVHAVFLSSLLTQYLWDMLESIDFFFFLVNPT